VTRPDTVSPARSSPAESAPDAVVRRAHVESAERVLRRLDSRLAGLSPEEAAHRLAAHGANLLPEAARTPAWRRLLAQFHNALIYLLLAAALAAGGLGYVVDATVILAVVVINALVGFIQEGRAETALRAIRDLAPPQARVVREGRRVTVPVAELVPGDLVLLEAGDRVPADLRLVTAQGLLIDEAILTGESAVAEKQTGAVMADTALGDRHCMAYAATWVVAGHGSGVVVATGMDSEVGRISALLRDVRVATTPLLDQLDRFARRFLWVALPSAALVFLFAVGLRGYPWPQALIAVVAILVGAVPEGLPAVISITLAIGVRRMARRHAAIRRLPAVETLGAVSVIASDKTGTLTRNEMTVCRLESAAARAAVTGCGYRPEGRLEPATGEAGADWSTLIRAGVLCSDADLVARDGDWQVVGDPMEGALLMLAHKAGQDPETLRADWPRLDEIPFGAEHRFMATVNRAPDGRHWLFIKGAPDALLTLCRREARADGDGPLDPDAWAARIEAIAGAGERVLGFAAKPLVQSGSPFRELGDGLVFLGVAGFIDPPRDEAVAAVAECRRAGIDVKMITGDHVATALAIARDLGLAERPRALTGQEIESLSAEALADQVGAVQVFARTTPAHKLRIVQALQADDAVVAMTGDGVNDAPALKQADVGIGMGHKGTDAAKEAAQMVLLDDNFASIVAAVREGRVVHDNIRKVVAWTLPTNGGEVMTVIAALLFGFTLPMSAVQILWINLVTAVTLGLVLAFEPAEPGVMTRPPRPRRQGLLTRLLVWRVVFVSLLFTGVALGMFFLALARHADLALARTLVVNTLIALEVVYLFSVRISHTTALTWHGVMGTRAVLAGLAVVALAQLAFTYLPVMQRLFETRPLGADDLAWLAGVAVAALGVLELEKWLVRRVNARNDG